MERGSSPAEALARTLPVAASSFTIRSAPATVMYSVFPSGDRERWRGWGPVFMTSSAVPASRSTR